MVSLMFLEELLLIYLPPRRLTTTHSLLSHLQFPHGNRSTTSHLTLRDRQERQARRARRLLFLCRGSVCHDGDSGFDSGLPPSIALVEGTRCLSVGNEYQYAQKIWGYPADKVIFSSLLLRLRC
jgi:hypothetical protein